MVMPASTFVSNPFGETTDYSQLAQSAEEKKRQQLLSSLQSSTTPQVFTAADAQLLGLDLSTTGEADWADWQVELTPNAQTESGYDITVISPDNYKYFSDQSIQTPQGQKFTAEQWAAVGGMETAVDEVAAPPSQLESLNAEVAASGRITPQQQGQYQASLTDLTSKGAVATTTTLATPEQQQVLETEQQETVSKALEGIDTGGTVRFVSTTVPTFSQLQTKTQDEIAETFDRVFTGTDYALEPIEDIVLDLRERANTEPDEFVKWFTSKVKSEDLADWGTVLKVAFPNISDENIAGFYSWVKGNEIQKAYEEFQQVQLDKAQEAWEDLQRTYQPFTTGGIKWLPGIDTSKTLEGQWQAKVKILDQPDLFQAAQDDPEKFDIAIKTIGRNLDTDRIIRTIYPEKTEVELAEYFYGNDQGDFSFEKVSRYLTAGVGDIFSSTGGAAKWLGIDTVGQELGEIGGEMQLQAPPDSELWGQVVRMLPFQVAMLPTYFMGIGVAGAIGTVGRTAATALNLGKIGTAITKVVLPAAQFVGGATIPRAVESLMEAGDTYNQAIAMGWTEAEADKAASGVFKHNMLLIGMDAFQFATAFGGMFFPSLAKPASSLIGKGLATVGRFGMVALTEGGEEYYQAIVQKQALGEDIDTWAVARNLSQDEIMTATILGAIGGVGFGGVGEVATRIQGAIPQNVSEQTQAQANKEIAELVRQGTPVAEARNQVLANHINEKEYQEAIKKVIEAETINGYAEQIEGDQTIADKFNTYFAQKWPEVKGIARQVVTGESGRIGGSEVVVRYKRNYGSGKSAYIVEYEYNGERYITGTIIRGTEKSQNWYFGKGAEGLKEANRIALLSDEEFAKLEDDPKYSWSKIKKTLTPPPAPAQVAEDVVPAVTPTATAVKGETVGEAAVAGEVITEEQYLATHGAGFMEGAEPGLHKNIPEGAAKERAIARQQKEMAANNVRREELRQEYQAKVASGEIRPPTRNESLLATARGNPDNASVQAARRLLEKKGINWQEVVIPEVAPAEARPLTDALQTEYTNLVNQAEKIAPDSPIVKEAKEIINGITPENQTQKLAEFERKNLEEKLNGVIGEVTPEATTGEAIAKELGITYDGIQEGLGMQFTDPQTGSTFYGNTLDEVRANLENMRGKFEGNLPPIEPPSFESKPIVPDPEKPLAQRDEMITVAKRKVDLNPSNAITKMADKVPGLKQFLEFFKPKLKLDTPENINIHYAMVAEYTVQPYVEQRLYTGRVEVKRALAEAFGKDVLYDKESADVQYIGPNEEYLQKMSLLDICNNPERYKLTAEQQRSIDMINPHLDWGSDFVNNGFVEDAKNKIGRFGSKPGGAFLSNVDIGEDVIEIMGSEMRAVTTGRGKTRVYETSLERSQHAEKTGQKFTPQMNVAMLLDGMDAYKAKVAGSETYRKVLGGKTKLEAIEATHPKLFEDMITLRKRLQSLEGTLRRLDVKQADAIKEFLDSSVEDVDLTNLQAELNPEITRGKRKGKDIQAVKDEIRATKDEITKIRPSWESANLKPFVQDKEFTYRYFTAEQVNLIKETRKVSNNPVVNLLDQLRRIAFGPDGSPITIQGSIAVLADPINSIKVVGVEGKGVVSSHNPLYPFTEDAILQRIAENPERMARFAALEGIAMGKTPTEFATGWASKIPGMESLNDSLFSWLRLRKEYMWEAKTNELVKSGVPELDAEIIAHALTNQIFPLADRTLEGQSQARAKLLRALPTSYSFMMEPAKLMYEATQGYAKVFTGQKLTPKENLSVRVMTTMAATTLFLCATSAAFTAKLEGKDDDEIWGAVWDAINPDPRNGKFLSIIAGNIRIPVGGPYRAIFRALYPDKVEGVGVPVPFASILNYFKNRMNPALRAQYDLITNKDYSGNQILKGGWPEKITRLLAYEVEGIAPLTIGQVIEDFRTDKIYRLLEDTLSQLAGVNAINMDDTYFNRMTKQLGEFDDEGKVKDTKWLWGRISPYVDNPYKPTPIVKSIIDTMKIKDEMETYANKPLYQINTDPSKGDTYEEYYAKGTITRREYDLLREYHNLDTDAEKEQFLLDHLEIKVDPRDEWLRSHPDENARLALYGQAKVLTKAAYDKVISMAEELDIPDNALVGLPPKEVSGSYFKYLDIVADGGTASSPESYILRLQDPAFSKWLEKENGLVDIATKGLSLEYLTLAVKYKEQDEIYEDITAAYWKTAYLIENPQYADSVYRREALHRKYSADMVNEYVAWQVAVKLQGYDNKLYLRQHQDLYNYLIALKDIAPIDFVTRTGVEITKSGLTGIYSR